MAKARINPIEQQTFVQGQPSTLRYSAADPNADLAAGLSRIAGQLSNTLYEQGKRIENLKFADNNEKLKITSGEMNLALSKAQNQADFDAIRKDYTDRMKNESKARLGNLYNKWEKLEGNNFLAAMDVDIKAKQIALNDKIARETAISTIDDMAYQWGYAPTDEARQAQDAVFNVWLQDSGFDEAEQQKYLRKYNHDKEHGYLTQELVKNPQKVINDLQDPENFKNLSIEERESFKGAAERQKEAMIKALDQGFDLKTSSDIGEIQGQADLQVQQKIMQINSAKEGNKWNPDKLDFELILSTWDYLDDLSKNPMEINNQVIQTPSGQYVYTMSRKKALEYQSKLLGPLMQAARFLKEDEQGAGRDSVFKMQLDLLSDAVQQGNINESQTADLMRAIWKENKSFSTPVVVNPNAPVNEQTKASFEQNGWFMQPIESLGNANKQNEYRRKGTQNFQTAFETYYLNRGNLKLNITDYPGEKMTIVDGDNVEYNRIPYEERMKQVIEWKNKGAQESEEELMAFLTGTPIQVNKSSLEGKPDQLSKKTSEGTANLVTNYQKYDISKAKVPRTKLYKLFVEQLNSVSGESK